MNYWAVLGVFVAALFASGLVVVSVSVEKDPSKKDRKFSIKVEND